MRVLVTGGAGFLGSHVCELFNSKGWEVISYDNYSKHELLRTEYNVEKARDYNSNFLKGIGVLVIRGDIREYDTVLKYARGCDYIINCAAQPAMTIAIEDPRFDAMNNIIGTLNILEAGRKLNIPVAICSTIHVYGNGDNKNLERYLDLNYYSYIEVGEYLTGSITPLHTSKYSTELYARAFTETYNSKVFTARLTGIYGPRQLGGEDHGWVANFAIRTLLGLPIKVFGTDKQVRDILYVTDAAQSFLDWFEHGKPSGVYNIGGGVPCITSIRQCLSLLSNITMTEQTIKMEPARKGDLWYFVCDTTKAKQAFGWQPGVLPKDGITQLVNWIRENQNLFRR